MSLPYEIRHVIAGRVRLRLPFLLRDPEFARRFVAWVGNLDGVRLVRYNPLCASVVIEHLVENRTFMPGLEARLRDLIPAELPALVSGLDLGEEKPKKLTAPGPSLSLPTLSLLLSLTLTSPLGLALHVPLLIGNALPVWRRAFTVLSQERRLNVDFLDGLAIAIALLQAQPFTGAFVIWLIRLGDWIRDRTGAASRRVMTNLLDYQGRYAWRQSADGVEQVPVNALQTGDIVLVYPGDLIPVDGEILNGTATIDQKTITGESMPVRRRTGETVYAGTAVREGKLVLRGLRVGNETTAAQIVHLVETAPIGETRIQNYAEKFADHLVTPWLATAIGVFALTGDVQRFLSMLIIDYGTGMRVAAPTTVLAAMIKAAHHGVLIKGGSHMEKLARVDTIVFDKTGTLTRGVPEVIAVICYRPKLFPERKILALAAATEARHTHPVAEAIRAKAEQEGIEVPERKESRYEIGLGMTAEVGGFHIHLGSQRFLQQNGIPCQRALQDIRRFSQLGASTLLFSVDGELTGLIPYTDQIRPESPAVLRALHNHGVKQTIMLTGDNATVAAAVAQRVGIDRYFSETLPADKAAVVRDLQQGGRVVAMVGDGINDSPALAYADIGIAMKNGADVARESADVVLMEDNLWKLMSAIELSQEAMDVIRQNFAIIAGLNTLAVALVIPTGFVSPGVTALISNGSAILASLNAMRPLLD